MSLTPTEMMKARMDAAGLCRCGSCKKLIAIYPNTSRTDCNNGKSAPATMAPTTSG